MGVSGAMWRVFWVPRDADVGSLVVAVFWHHNARMRAFSRVSLISSPKRAASATLRMSGRAAVSSLLIQPLLQSVQTSLVLSVSSEDLLVTRADGSSTNSWVLVSRSRPRL
jgi:hypothetical protein